MKNVKFYWTQLDEVEYTVSNCKTEAEVIGGLLAVNPQLIYFVQVDEHVIISEYFEVIIPFVKNCMELIGDHLETYDVCIIEFQTFEEAYNVGASYYSNNTTNACFELILTND